jgi:hypothetical protein
MEQIRSHRILHSEDAYPQEFITEEICIGQGNKLLICPVCLGILQDASTDICGHVFCHKCLKNIMDSTSRCPCTNLTFNNTTITKIPAMQNLINETQVRCLNTACQWIGKLEGLRRHIEVECMQVRIQCSNAGCSIFEVAKNISEHEDACAFKLKRCNLCTEYTVSMNFEKHPETCQGILITCPKDCGASFPRKESDIHNKTDCPNVYITCDFGCEKEFLRRDYAKHLNDNEKIHLLLASKLINDLKTLNLNQETEIKQLKSSLSENEEIVSMFKGRVGFEKLDDPAYWEWGTTINKFKAPFTIVFTITKMPKGSGNYWGGAIGVSSKPYTRTKSLCKYDGVFPEQDKDTLFCDEDSYCFTLTRGFKVHRSRKGEPHGVSCVDNSVVIMTVGQDHEMRFNVNGSSSTVAAFKLPPQEYYILLGLVFPGKITITSVKLNSDS